MNIGKEIEIVFVPDELERPIPIEIEMPIPVEIPVSVPIEIEIESDN